MRIAECRLFAFCQIKGLVNNDVVESLNTIGAHVKRGKIALLFHGFNTPDAQLKQQIGIKSTGIEIVAVWPGYLLVDLMVGSIVLLEVADFLMKIPKK
jgi:hypothetical protein